jgi:hypothetical protein
VSRWPWPAGDARYLASGRQALAWLVATVLPRGARVLCPACICASVVAGLRAGGAEVAFYPQDERLVPRWDAIGPADALLLWHPLGRRLPVAPVRALRRRWPRMAIIEDFSHTLLNCPPVATAADFGFASLRKLLPLADGGVAVAWRGRALPEAPEPAAAPSPFVQKRLDGDPTAEDDLDAWPGPPQPIWQGTLAALAALDPSELRRIRRRRYRAIERALAKVDGVRPFWPALPDGVAPYAFPARCRNRHDLRRELGTAEPFWPVLPEARAAAGLAGRMLAGTLLLVSCDPCLDNIRVRH